MFWLGEYANILLMCALGSILFLGGWLSPIDLYPLNLIPPVVWFIIKMLFLFILFALVKAIVPRYRYDQLMKLFLKIFFNFIIKPLVINQNILKNSRSKLHILKKKVKTFSNPISLIDHIYI